jgi:hypothetical protein
MIAHRCTGASSAVVEKQKTPGLTQRPGGLGYVCQPDWGQRGMGVVRLACVDMGSAEAFATVVPSPAVLPASPASPGMPREPFEGRRGAAGRRLYGLPRRGGGPTGLTNRECQGGSFAISGVRAFCCSSGFLTTIFFRRTGVFWLGHRFGKDNDINEH